MHYNDRLKHTKKIKNFMCHYYLNYLQCTHTVSKNYVSIAEFLMFIVRSTFFDLWFWFLSYKRNLHLIVNDICSVDNKIQG